MSCLLVEERARIARQQRLVADHMRRDASSLAKDSRTLFGRDANPPAVAARLEKDTALPIQSEREKLQRICP
jgi:hypothetical protein